MSAPPHPATRTTIAPEAGDTVSVAVAPAPTTVDVGDCTWQNRSNLHEHTGFSRCAKSLLEPAFGT
ncbi:MAG: hypothetical protein ACKO9D_11200, partial [Gammaproteobacteria bacterium]